MRIKSAAASGAHPAPDVAMPSELCCEWRHRVEFHGESECKRQWERTVLGRVGLPRIPVLRLGKSNFQVSLSYTVKP